LPLIARNSALTQARIDGVYSATDRPHTEEDGLDEEHREGDPQVPNLESLHQKPALSPSPIAIPYVKQSRLAAIVRE